MHKIRISVQYKYLNDEFGTFPYIHIGYINDSNEELMNVFNVLSNEKLYSKMKKINGYRTGKPLSGTTIKHAHTLIKTIFNYNFLYL